MRRLVIILVVPAAAAALAQASHHRVPPSKDGNVVLGLCDGETSLELAGVKPGEELTRAQAQKASDELMAQWKRKNDGASWDKEALLAQSAPAREQQTQGGSSAAPPAPATAGQTYGNFIARDRLIWAESTKAVVTDGDGIFHDAKRLGGTIGVSCDMCHPNAANTHPETYPKYQVQLGRVALLRDMINWCIENPVRGKPLADDDPRLKALEAYIIAQRKGVALDYGKH
jgi:thiosulfate dehydrogenase